MFIANHHHCFIANRGGHHHIIVSSPIVWWPCSHSCQSCFVSSSIVAQSWIVVSSCFRHQSLLVHSSFAASSWIVVYAWFRRSSLCVPSSSVLRFVGKRASRSVAWIVGRFILDRVSFHRQANVNRGSVHCESCVVTLSTV